MTNIALSENVTFKLFVYFVAVFWLCITERVEKTIHNVDAAMTSAGRQKRDVTQTMVVDQLKKKAADLMSKLKNKQQG